MSEEGIVDSGAGESNVPAGVREIITKSFGSHSWDHFELKDRMNPFAEERLKEENKLLKSELDRMERLLANVVSERDDIAVKYSDMSGRVIYVQRFYYLNKIITNTFTYLVE